MRLRFLLVLLICRICLAQSTTSGSVIGTVVDPSGAVMPNLTVELRNPVTGYSQTAVTDGAGVYHFSNVPQSTNEAEVSAQGFAQKKQTVNVVTSVPVVANFSLEVSGERTAVEVTASTALIDTAPTARTDVDSSLMAKLPVVNAAAGLSSMINYSTGGTASDAKGFFHPLGDHAQVSFVIDGQPINDQQSKVFSTQLPPNAIQSMELITGAPEAQFGDKSSLVVNATTKSGLCARPFGSLEANWGSFGTWGENATLGAGTPTFENFLVLNGLRTGHFLDTPEFLPIHDIGNNETIFDRIDYQPGRDSYHLNLYAIRNWFQNPNSYDRLTQDQKQRVMTWNRAPGYQHLFDSATLFTVNAFLRRDQVNYYGSRDPLNDTPATESQLRFLTNYGVKADVARAQGVHNLKAGIQLQQTRLVENFRLGSSTRLSTRFASMRREIRSITAPAACRQVNPSYRPNPAFLPGLVSFDLTRGGSLFGFHGAGNVNQYAFYLMDDIRLKHFTFNLGLLDDQ